MIAQVNRGGAGLVTYHRTVHDGVWRRRYRGGPTNDGDGGRPVRRPGRGVAGPWKGRIPLVSGRPSVGQEVAPPRLCRPGGHLPGQGRSSWPARDAAIEPSL